MDSRQLIDAQFDRAVEIIQGLPKTGPIQTGYEEKLTMYSLYKQATVGNVTSTRPAIWDMLGRAKWEAWAKHKDLDSYEAKWLYVDALLKVLRKYSDKTMARSLVEELESFGADLDPPLPSSALFKPSRSSSSGSTDSEPTMPPAHIQDELLRPPHDSSRVEVDSPSEGETDETDDEVHNPVEPTQPPNRPQSSISENRYRTPMASTLATSPPPPAHMGVPQMQPLPFYETPSAFAGPAHVSMPPSEFPTTSSYVGQFSEISGVDVEVPLHIYPAHPLHPANAQYNVPQSASRVTLERAIEHMQAHLAALNERLETLEFSSGRPQRSSIALTHSSSPAWGSGAGARTPIGRGGDNDWDLDDLGMWSLVLNPASRGLTAVRQAVTVFARAENRSPWAIVVRRLVLDISFLICVLAVFRTAWRRSVVRRREIKAALVLLGRAILGRKKPRTMIDRGV